MTDGFLGQIPDVDPDETAEWIDSFESVAQQRGRARASFLLARLEDRAQDLGIDTPYINTIPRHEEPWFPGDEMIERRIRAVIRWNAVAMVVRANQRADGIGGHLSTFASFGRALRRGLQPLLPRARTTATPATTCTSRATPPPASTPARSSRVA
jgi:pyruvate dehydrogenase E1 component